jgi:hypothetical protein
MRISAKLNLFLGVPNTGEIMLPPHLKYLGAFFRRRKLNLLFPISMIATTFLSVLLIGAAASTQAWGFQAGMLTLLATLSSLAWIEHWMLILPMRADAPWRLTPLRIRCCSSPSKRIGYRLRSLKVQAAAACSRSQGAPLACRLAAARSPGRFPNYCSLANSVAINARNAAFSRTIGLIRRPLPGHGAPIQGWRNDAKRHHGKDLAKLNALNLHQRSCDADWQDSFGLSEDLRDDTVL